MVGAWEFMIEFSSREILIEFSENFDRKKSVKLKSEWVLSGDDMKTRKSLVRKSLEMLDEMYANF